KKPHTDQDRDQKVNEHDGKSRHAEPVMTELHQRISPKGVSGVFFGLAHFREIRGSTSLYKISVTVRAPTYITAVAPTSALRMGWSPEVMASYATRPTPGILKYPSNRMLPPMITNGMVNTIRVMIGIMQFFNT